MWTAAENTEQKALSEKKKERNAICEWNVLKGRTPGSLTLLRQR